MKTIFSKLQAKGNSKLTNIVFLVFFALLISLNTQSQTTVVSVRDGNWSDSTTWAGGIPPWKNDTVKINGHTVTLTDDAHCAHCDDAHCAHCAHCCNQLIIQSNGSFINNDTITLCADLKVTNEFDDDSNTFTNNSGATLTINGNLDISDADFTFNNYGTVHLAGDWINTGTFNGQNGTVTFNGSSAQSLKGETNFYNLTMDNSSTGLTLNNNITVTNNLTMTDGDINLNGDTIDLSSTGTLIGEDENYRIYGTPGVITTTRDIGAPGSLNVGGLGAVLTSGTDMGSTTVTRGHVEQTGEGHTSIWRYYDISPKNNSGLNATFRFYYFENELNGQTESADLKLYKSTDGGSTWANEGGTIDVDNDYVEVNGIDGFSIWTIGYETGEPLHIELLSFTADCRDGTAEINWATASETNNDYFTLEKCRDEACLVSDNWEIVTIVKGAGNSNTISNYRVIDALQLADETIYYRLKKTDFNGAFAYSNTIATNCLQREVEFKFIGVTAQDNEGFINVLFNSDAGHSYKLELYDILGRLLITERLQESVYGLNAIKANTSVLPEITYLIVLQNNNEILIVKISYKI